jgi:hypothetical protein
VAEVQRLVDLGILAARSPRTYRQVSHDTGIPLEVLGGILESMGFVR